MKTINKNIIRLLALACVLIMIAAVVLPAGALDVTESESTVGRRIIDEAGILSDKCEKDLDDLFTITNEAYGYNICFAAVNSLGSKTAREYADDLYDSIFPINSNGIILIVSLEYRDYWLSTSGDAISTFDADSRLSNLDSAVLGCLRDNDFEDAAKTFALLVNSCLEAVRRYNEDKDGNPAAWQNSYCELISDYWVKRVRPSEYDSLSFKGIMRAISEAGDGSVGIYDYGATYLKTWGKKFFIVLVIAAVIAFIWLGVMKAKMNNVKRNNLAADYVRPDSFKLTQSTDLFLYSTVSKTTRHEADTSTGRSSGGGGGGGGGGSHGGSGGKF